MRLPVELVKKNWLNIAIVVILLGLLSLLVLRTQGDDGVVNATQSSPPQTGMSREEAIDAAKRTVANVTRIDAKLTTWGDFNRLSSPGSWVASPGPDTRVWAVAAQGQYEGSGPPGANTTYPWAVVIFDAEYGYLLSVAADVRGLWPPYWAAIVDLSA